MRRFLGTAALAVFALIFGAQVLLGQTENKLWYFGASGPGHMAGLVPDPGSVAGSIRFLREDAQWIAVAGTGTVTQVNVTGASFLNITGSGYTTTGTVNLGLANQNASLVFVGPTAGGAAAAPTFRLLRPDDFATYTSGTVCLQATSASAWLFGSCGGAIPTGTGFYHVTAGVLDAASKTVDLSSGDAVGILAAARFPALTGDVTTSAGALGTTIGTNVVTNAKAAQMATNTIKGNNTGSTANALDLTVAQVKTLLGDAPSTRLINTTAPLAGGGDLSADRTLSIAATTTNDGGTIVKQASTPGTAQTGHLNITGTAIAPTGIHTTGIGASSSQVHAIPALASSTLVVVAGAQTLANKTFSTITVPTGAAGIAGTATLAAGTKTVSTTAVTASSVILLTRKTAGGTVGDLRLGAIVAGTSFVISSASGSDTSVVNWLIVN